MTGKAKNILYTHTVMDIVTSQMNIHVHLLGGCPVSRLVGEKFHFFAPFGNNLAQPIFLRVNYICFREILTYKKNHLVCLLELTADFEVKSKSRFDTAVSVDTNTHAKQKKGEEGQIAVHISPSWTMTPIFAYNFLMDILLYYNLSDLFIYLCQMTQILTNNLHNLEVFAKKQ